MTGTYSTIIQKPNRLRIIAIITGLMIGLPLCTYLFFSTTSFFARASDEIPRDVTISHISKSSAVVVWTTDKPTLSVVEYGLDPVELSLYGPELEPRREHEVELNLLSPGTTYYFQIRNNETVYDNAGVPWTFTTRTTDGSSGEEVQGVMTELTPLVTKKPTKAPNSVSQISTSKCDVTDCNESEIISKFGKGCSSADLIKCRNTNTTKSSTLTPVITYSTPFPTPTSVSIDSDLCKLKNLHWLNSCTTWEWNSINLSTKLCRDAFDRYILQCQNVSFGSEVTSSDYQGSYVINNADYTLKTLPITPTPGKTIYCRVRAVDTEGSDEGESHATPWISAEKKCE